MISVLIVEDETPIAGYIESLVRKIWIDKTIQIYIRETIDAAEDLLKETDVDLCLLDIHVYDESGYTLLKKFTERSFQTIVISANRDKAIEAFEHDVLDFVPKPFSQSRLAEALERYTVRSKNRDFFKDSIFSEFSGEKVRYALDKCLVFEAAHVYSKIHFFNQKTALLNKTMSDLEAHLPNRFLRCHRSFIIDITQIKEILHFGGGKYGARLLNGLEIPVSRTKYKKLSKLINQLPLK
jgi:DNA-binding LytR/AlgR family response regulator